VRKSTLIILVFLICGIVAPSLGAQTIKTATTLFNETAQFYTDIYDYIADVTIKIDDITMHGTLMFKRPNKIRIDFYSPEKQVIVSDGDILQVYIPKYDVTLKQKLDSQAKDPTGGAGMASSQGLNLLKKGYGIAYKIGPNTVPLDDGAPAGSGEQVYKLSLNWQNQSQGFRLIELSISPGKMIRRIESVTADKKKIRIDYTNIRLNVGLTSNKFDYDAPASSNVYDNFLFGTTN